MLFRSQNATARARGIHVLDGVREVWREEAVFFEAIDIPELSLLEIDNRRRGRDKSIFNSRTFVLVA